MVSLRGRLSVGFGLWVVGTAAPPLQYLVSGSFTGVVGWADVAIFLGLFAVGTAVASRGLPTEPELSRRFRSGVELGVPLLFAAITLLAALSISIVWGVLQALPFALGGGLGFLAAFLVGYWADQAVIARSRAITDHRLSWTAKKLAEAMWFRLLRISSILVTFGLALVVWIAGGVLLAVFWVLVGLLQIGLLVSSRQRRQYELTDDGLISIFGFLPWEQFEGYELTDDALVLYGTVWPFGTVAYDRESIDDLDAVCETLDRYLPERTIPDHERSAVEQFRRLLSS